MLAFRLNTFALFCLVVVSFRSTLAAELIELGRGWEPKWSPNGELVSAWTLDTLFVYKVSDRTLQKAIAIARPKFYFWVNNDRLALSYQTDTEAPHPMYRDPIVTRGLLDLSGSYRVIKCDTAFDTRNALTHFQQLPDGKVGVFDIQDGLTIAFHALDGDTLKIVAVDTSSREECWRRLKALRTGFPSRDCAKIVTFTSEDQVLIIDSSGATIANLGPRSTRLESGKYSAVCDPKWSANSNHLALLTYVEDGHYLYGTTLTVVNAHTGQITLVRELNTDGWLDAEWSPRLDQLAVVCEGEILLWLAD